MRTIVKASLEDHEIEALKTLNNVDCRLIPCNACPLSITKEICLRKVAFNILARCGGVKNEQTNINND